MASLSCDNYKMSLTLNVHVFIQTIIQTIYRMHKSSIRFCLLIQGYEAGDGCCHNFLRPFSQEASFIIHLGFFTFPVPITLKVNTSQVTACPHTSAFDSLGYNLKRDFAIG